MQVESVQQHRVTSETPAEMQQNHQNVSWIALPQRSHPAVRAHISIINISVRRLARHLHRKATGLMRTFSRGRIGSTGLCEQAAWERWFSNQSSRLWAAFNNTNHQQGRNSDLGLYFCVKFGCLRGCLPEGPGWLTSSCIHHVPFTACCSLRCGSELPVYRQTYWRELEEPCRAAEANDELHCEW